MTYTHQVKRTQIYIDEDLDRRLRAAAAAEGRSAASLVRDAVRRYLGGRDDVPGPDPFLAVAGSVAGGPRDAALNHDRYIYRSRRSTPK